MKKLFLALMFLCGCASSVPPASGAKWFGAITPIQFAGDLSGDYTTQNVLKWRGKSLDATTMGAPTDAQIPIYVNGSSAWKSVSLSGDATISNGGVVSVAASAKGITQLTGPVTAGPGFGSQVTTLAQNGALTGNTYGWSGAAWVPAALNLAGGSNFVTGVLPAGNQAAQNLSGDVTGTTAASTAINLTGTAGVATVGNGPIRFDYSTATAPLVQSGASASSLTVGTTKVGATSTLSGDLNLPAVKLSAGTGSQMKLDLTSQSGTSQSNITSDNSGIISWNLGGNFWDVINSSAELLLNSQFTAFANTQNFQNYAGTLGLTLTPAATTTISFSANVTAGQISWTGAAAAAGGSTSIVAQTAGGTNDGGQVVLTGGTHAGPSTTDGSVKITTPLNGGFFSLAPGVSTTLTNAQSDANFTVITPSAPVTVTWLRRIADTSCVWIKNANAGGVALTVSYLTGGTVSLASSTSALVCSDGANLQKVMTGT